MQNNNPNNYLQKDEIDLIELFKFLIHSKKLIFATTLVITTLGTIYAYQMEPEYKSTAIVEAGNYNLCTGYSATYYQEQCNAIVDPVSTLSQEILIYTHRNKMPGINDVKVEGLDKDNKLFEISTISHSSVISENYLNDIITHAQNVHSNFLNEIVQKKADRLKNKINTLNTLIESLNSKDSDYLTRHHQLINDLEKQISFVQELNDLEKSYFYMESNLTLLSNILDADSHKIIDFKNDISEFENELVNLKNQSIVKTGMIGQIVTINYGLKKEIIILLSFIFGLLFSVVFFLLKKSLKDFKEKLV
jgi:hypothetical protein